MCKFLLLLLLPLAAMGAFMDSEDFRSPSGQLTWVDSTKCGTFYYGADLPGTAADGGYMVMDIGDSSCMIVYDPATAHDTVYLQSYFYIDSTNIANANSIGIFRVGVDISNTTYRMALYNTSGQLGFYLIYRANGSTTQETPKHNISLDAWYRIRVKYDRTNLNLQFYVDETLVDDTTVSAMDRTIGHYMIGPAAGHNTSDRIVNFYTRDFSISDTGFAADVLLPTKVANCSLLVRSSGGSGGQSVSPSGMTASANCADSIMLRAIPSSNDSLLKWTKSSDSITFIGNDTLNDTVYAKNVSDTLSDTATAVFCWRGWDCKPPVAINETGGDVNIHYSMGYRRIVRVRDTVIAIVNRGSAEEVWRGVNGVWMPIDTMTGQASSLLRDSAGYVYWFNRDASNNLQFVKFLPSTEGNFTYTDIAAIGETEVGAYRMTTCTIDSNNCLYVATTGNSGGSTNPDSIIMYRSDDTGATWTELKSPSGTIADDGWYAPSLDVTDKNVLLCAFQRWRSAEIMPAPVIVIARSFNKGTAWDTVWHNTSDSVVRYPCIVSIGDSAIAIAAQKQESTSPGAVCAYSANFGVTLSEWRNIFTSQLTTAGYGDPTMCKGVSDTLYALTRSTATDATQYRAAVYKSADSGATWVMTERHANDTACGAKSTMRYQNWYSGGGPLEWLFLQPTKGATNSLTMYDVNTVSALENNVPSVSTDTCTPVITDNPSDSTVDDSSFVTFSALATGCNVSYTWERDTGTGFESECDSIIMDGEGVTIRLAGAGKTYCLGENITSTDTGLIVAAAGITVDGRGHTITFGTGGAPPRCYGVFSTQVNTTVRNCVVVAGSKTQYADEPAYVGVRITGAGSLIHDNVITVDSLTASHCIVINKGVAAYNTCMMTGTPTSTLVSALMVYDTSNIFFNTIFADNAHGIECSFSKNTTINDNTIVVHKNNEEHTYAIYGWYAENSIASNNTILGHSTGGGHDLMGIVLGQDEGSHDNLTTGNKVFMNCESGTCRLVYGLGYDNIITENTMRTTTSHGLYFRRSEDGYVTNNIIVNDNAEAIRADMYGNVVRDTVTGNYLEGAYILSFASTPASWDSVDITNNILVAKIDTIENVPSEEAATLRANDRRCNGDCDFDSIKMVINIHDMADADIDSAVVMVIDSIGRIAYAGYSDAGLIDTFWIDSILNSTTGDDIPYFPVTIYTTKSGYLPDTTIITNASSKIVTVELVPDGLAGKAVFRFFATTSMTMDSIRVVASNDSGPDTSTAALLTVNIPTPQYTLTVTDNGAGGTTTPSGASSVDSGVGTAIQADTATGYRFVRWDTSGVVSIADIYDASTACTLHSGNATVTAIFYYNILGLRADTVIYTSDSTIRAVYRFNASPQLEDWTAIGGTTLTWSNGTVEVASGTGNVVGARWNKHIGATSITARMSGTGYSAIYADLANDYNGASYLANPSMGGLWGYTATEGYIIKDGSAADNALPAAGENMGLFRLRLETDTIQYFWDVTSWIARPHTNAFDTAASIVIGSAFGTAVIDSIVIEGHTFTEAEEIPASAFDRSKIWITNDSGGQSYFDAGVTAPTHTYDSSITFEVSEVSHRISFRLKFWPNLYSGVTQSDSVPLMVSVHSTISGTLDEILSYTDAKYAQAASVEHLITMSFCIDTLGDAGGTWYWGSILGGTTPTSWVENKIVELVDSMRTQAASLLFERASCDSLENRFVDINRVYIEGHSLGGTAAYRIGIKHPEIFAAVNAHAGYANFWENPAHDFSGLIGDTASHLTTAGLDGETYSARDYTDMGWFVWDHAGASWSTANGSRYSPPYVMMSHGKTDVTVTIDGANSLQRDADSSGAAYSYFKYSGNHGDGDTARLETLLNFRRDQSYVGFSMSTKNDSATWYNNLDSLGWYPDSIVDSASAYQVVLFNTGTDTVDVSLHNLQSLSTPFNVKFEVLLDGAIFDTVQITDSIVSVDRIPVSDHTVLRFETVPQYTITGTDVGNGTHGFIPENDSVADSNSTVRIYPIPDVGNVFVDHSGDTSGIVLSGDTATFTMSEDRSVTLTFEPDTVSLTLTIVGTGLVDTLPSGKNGLFQALELCTLIALYAPPDTVVTWSGASSGHADTVIITMDTDKSVTAKFSSGAGTATRRCIWGGFTPSFRWGGR